MSGNSEHQDTRKPLQRRAVLHGLGALLALSPIAALAGCGGAGDTGSGGTAGTGGTGGSGGGGAGGTGGSGGTGGGTTTSNSSTSTTSSECKTIPDETAGPYPDKTNMIADQKWYRQDVTEGKTGLPLALTYTVVQASNGCAPVSGAVVEIWHCDAAGDYSEYTQPGYDGTGQTFLRGLQTADANGVVQFTTIYPGWYQGRVTHVHIEVYVNGKSVKVTQMAFPDDVTAQVYAVDPYKSKGQSPMTNAQDMVFSDGDELQMANLTGDTMSGFKATLTITI